jgi:hypothetical protein
MKTVVTNSLAETLNTLNEAFFLKRDLTWAERIAAARWIADRQGRLGSYAGMFAPTVRDFKNGIKVFTGEAVRSNAATGHILGEEACRALIRLDVPDPKVKAAQARARLGMLKRLRDTENRGKVHGMYCCGICSVAYWRNVTAGGLDRNQARLTAGMKQLRAHRLGNGQWRRFPFFYTLLALSAIDLKSAAGEMKYAAPVCERYLKHSHGTGAFARRRRLLAECILARC